MSRPPMQRCAIYTRKSSDEGLDQAFNSLDAQLEAGEAYVKSQAHEGWKPLPALYDDGGYSGGSLERPALQRLLTDVDAGRIDVVVVYKIDRLTRSLADFARIVERFDARGVSFVSVTQAFNTTSSMGRLTLNVLLSFAQFEREVTGERIRDKIAASKAKGMWMGGVPPLGYDLPAAGSRTLLVNEAEAETVREIFARYLALGSVHRLQDDLTLRGVVSKRWITAGGKDIGGVPLSRGALFHLLRSRVYLGQIVHKDAVHPGDHPAIVEAALFEQVQQRLAAGRRRVATTGERRTAAFPLTGKLRDAAGEAMSPVHARGRSGRLYRYYVSASLQQGHRHQQDGVVRRVPAAMLEEIVAATLAAAMPGREPDLGEVRAVHLGSSTIAIHLTRARRKDLAQPMPGEMWNELEDGDLVIIRTVRLPLRGGRSSVAAASQRPAAPDPVLVAALRRAHAMLGGDAHGPLLTSAPHSWYERRLVRLALLAPDLQRDILAGRQPAALTLQAFLRSDVPLAWAEQGPALGWH